MEPACVRAMTGSPPARVSSMRMGSVNVGRLASGTGVKPGSVGAMAWAAGDGEGPGVDEHPARAAITRRAAGSRGRTRGDSRGRKIAVAALVRAHRERQRRHEG